MCESFLNFQTFFLIKYVEIFLAVEGHKQVSVFLSFNFKSIFYLNEIKKFRL